MEQKDDISGCGVDVGGDSSSVQSTINNGPAFLLVCPAIATYGGYSLKLWASIFPLP